MTPLTIISNFSVHILQKEFLHGWASLYLNEDQTERKDIYFYKVISDSRKLKKGDLFFGFDGIHHTVPDFLEDVISKKPSAIFADIRYRAKIKKYHPSMPVFLSDSYRKKAHELLCSLHHNPSESMILTGVTGTNGKTSIAYYDYKLSSRGIYIGTLGSYIGNKYQKGFMTTPDFISTLDLLSKEKNAESASIEVSSHALNQDRLTGLQWDYVIFTNLSQDHLDYHKSMENYYKAKRKLFDEAISQKRKKNTMLINTDDVYGMKLYSEFSKKHSEVYSYGKNENTDFQIQEIQKSINGYNFLLRITNQAREKLDFLARKIDLYESMLFKTNLLGEFNIYNITPVIAAKILSGMNIQNLQKKIEDLLPAPGRMQKILWDNNRLVVIDYAHTPDALKNGLKTLRELNPRKIITVFGAGGDRDRRKRPLMAQAAEEYSDTVILTNDNPRNENPEKILEEIEQGFSRNFLYKKILDRESAIRFSLKNLEANGIVYIAGKGHEDYQVIGDNKIFFSDYDIVKKITMGDL